MTATHDETHDETRDKAGDGAGEGAGEEESAPGDERPRRRRYRGVIITLAVIGLLVAAAGYAVPAWRQSTYDRNVKRLDGALPPSSAARPPVDPGQNWLLVGSDLRGVSTPEKWQAGKSDSDAIMLLHLPESRERAYIISIPRDSWVNVPGYGMAKIKNAFSAGGPRLLIQTVEQLTAVHIDHVAAIDFQGFKQMTDALGGVEIDLKYPVQDPTNAWSWPAGPNRLNGDEALQFVRERKGLPGADVDRVKRQQAFIKAMAEKAVSTGTLTNPVKLDGFLQAVSRAVAIDDTADFGTLRGLGLRLASVGTDKITFVSVPVGSTAWVGEQNVVLLNQTVSAGLFEAVRTDRIGDYVEQHGLSNEVDEVQ